MGAVGADVSRQSRLAQARKENKYTIKSELFIYITVYICFFLVSY